MDRCAVPLQVSHTFLEKNWVFASGLLIWLLLKSSRPGTVSRAGSRCGGGVSRYAAHCSCPQRCALRLSPQGFLRPLHAQRSPFGHLPGHQVLDVHHLVLLVLERYPLLSTGSRRNVNECFIVLRYQERGLEAIMLIPRRDQLTVRVQGLLASSILFVKREKRQRDFSNPPLHGFFFFFLCRSQKNCPSVPEPLIARGDVLVCGSHFI